MQRANRNRWRVLAASLAILAACGDGGGEGARVAPGALDESFGTGGIVTTRLPESRRNIANAVAVQPDGKILAAGATSDTAVIARYRPDGTPDGGFGSAGVVATDLGTEATGLALQPDGTIVVALNVRTVDAQRRLGVARFDAHGEVDPTFGTGGLAALPVGIQTRTRAGALQPDGKIIVVGESRPGLPQQTEIFVARLGAG